MTTPSTPARQTWTAISLLIDRSGSMSAIQEAAEEGINGFIASQRGATDRRTIRIAQFDHEHGTVCPSTDPAAIEPFKLVPRGTTRLLDAMGRSIAEFSAEIVALPSDARPDVIIFAVMTDGHENSSQEFKWPEVKGMVEHVQKEHHWEVLYLGANQDAIAVAAKLGVAAHRSLTYGATDHGTRSATGSLGAYTAAAAAGAPRGFTDAQRTDAATP